jgi:hypothetical protein
MDVLAGAARGAAGDDFQGERRRHGRDAAHFRRHQDGATIKLNGKKIGEATDQFVKYNFSIAEGLLAQVDRQGTLQDSTLEVVFDLPTNGRFAACSGGWDWGPYSNTYQVCTALHAVHGLAAWPTSIACRVRG